MKNKRLCILVGVLIISLAISGVVSAALPGSGWWTSYWVQNVGGDDGVITMTAYDSATAQVFDSQEFTFDFGRTLVYDPGVAMNYPAGNVVGFLDPIPAGFEGSVVLSSNVESVATAQLSNFRNSSVGLVSSSATGNYQAFSAQLTDTELRFPIVKNNWSNAATTFYIQSASESGSNVSMSYYMGDGIVYQDTQFIEANKTYMFDPTAAGVPFENCGRDFNESPCFGAAVATSDTPIAGVVVEHPFQGSPIGAILTSRALTAADADTVLFAPSIKNNYVDAVAGASVMNIGNEDAKVRITITVTIGPNAGQVYTDEIIIPPNMTQTFSRHRNNLGGMPVGNFGAARIESVADGVYSPQPLVGMSNETKAQTLTPMGYARTTHYLFAIGAASDTNAAPKVIEYVGNFTGGMTVVNVGNAPTTIYFEYYDHRSDQVFEFWTTDPVQPGAAINTGRIARNRGGRFTNDGSFSFSEMNNKEFSAIAYTNDGTGIVNLITAFDPATNKFYDTMNYEGFSLD